MTSQEYDDLINSMSGGAPSYDDLDLSDLSFDFDTSNLSDIDFGSNFDLSAFNDSGIDFGNIDFGDIDVDARRMSLPDLDFGSNFDLGSYEDIAAVDAGNMAAENASNLDELIKGFSDVEVDGSEEVPFSESASQYKQPSAEERAAELERYQRSLTGENAGLELGAGEGVQDFGSSVDLDKSMSDFNTNLTDIMENRGGFTSGFQNVGPYKVMVHDDGTGTAIKNDGSSTYGLSVEDVNNMIGSGKINTFASGYNTATGGNQVAPGGGSSVVLKNGKEGQLLTNGTVINKDTGTVIGKKEDVQTVVTSGGDGTVITKKPEITTTTDKDKPKTPDKPKPPDKESPKKNDLSYLLPLLLAVLAMNRGGGGGGGSGASIPSLSADRKQLPYGPASGSTARPGAGGVTYFSPTTYTKKAAGGGLMYGGGGLSSLGGYSDGGRLLKGPGDGVSDSIPATIGGKQPARLATGEFVIPARIVSELGNGSTEAGAKKLYAMMRRVQNARRKTKNVAADTKAHKYLPA